MSQFLLVVRKSPFCIIVETDKNNTDMFRIVVSGRYAILARDVAL